MYKSGDIETEGITPHARREASDAGQDRLWRGRLLTFEERYWQVLAEDLEQDHREPHGSSQSGEVITLRRLKPSSF